jgi:hypothetical protein
MRNEGVAPGILNFGTSWWWIVYFSAVPTGWIWKPVWTLWRGKRSHALAGNRLPIPRSSIQQLQIYIYWAILALIMLLTLISLFYWICKPDCRSTLYFLRTCEWNQTKQLSAQVKRSGWKVTRWILEVTTRQSRSTAFPQPKQPLLPVTNIWVPTKHC